MKIDQIHWRFIKARTSIFQVLLHVVCVFFSVSSSSSHFERQRQNAVYIQILYRNALNGHTSQCWIWSVTDRRLFVQFMKYYFSDLLRSHLHAKMLKCIFIAFVLFILISFWLVLGVALFVSVIALLFSSVARLVFFLSFTFQRTVCAFISLYLTIPFNTRVILWFLAQPSNVINRKTLLRFHFEIDRKREREAQKERKNEF